MMFKTLKMLNPLVNSVKKKYLTVLTLFISLFNLTTIHAQCIEIESILVDACAPSGLEGQNEMVRFKVGGSDLSYNAMNVTWATASNPWGGIIQNSVTAQNTADLNASILGCGRLIEPTSQILPANSTVIIVTSYDMDVSSNSFANLNDTIYIIYQNSTTGNYGHFANYNSNPGSRHLTISFSNPYNCSKHVAYERNDLINQSGGSSAQDGATANFSSSGTTSYTNNGCQAPIQQSAISAEVMTGSSLQICPGDSINLRGVLTGNFDSLEWSGGFGTYSSSTQNTTTYYSSTTDIDSFYIKIKGFNSCGFISDSVLVYFKNNSISILEGDSASLCTGETLTLNAVGGSGNYLWSTNATNRSINITSPSLYFVTDPTNNCSDTATIKIKTRPKPVATIIGSSTFCREENLFLNATGIGSFTWSNGDIGNSTTISSAQVITLTATNTCGSDTSSIKIKEKDCSSSDSIFIPNVITPNNDLLNDVFQITGTGISSVLGKIYNRWGTLIFEWNDIDVVWKAEDSNQGTYFYIIDVTFESKEPETFKGSIQLFK